MPSLKSANGHLLRRLLALFVCGALLPVALSDWLVISATSDIARDLDARQRAATARAASRGVLDRLMTGEAFLHSIAAESSPASQTTYHVGGAAFEVVECGASENGEATGSSGSGPLDAWRAAAGPTSGMQAIPGHTAALRLHKDSHGSHVLMGASADGRTCAAEFRDDFLWEPLHNAAEDTAWQVTEGHGMVISQVAGADAPLVDDGGLSRVASPLFLESKFGSGTWNFIETSPPAVTQWRGLSIVVWLSSVAAATLLVVGLFGRSRLRRALAPLAALTDGTRRLALGERDVKVDVKRDDEIGTLANCFNDMAEQLHAREAELVVRAVRDDLTGLANRFALHEAIESLLGGRALDPSFAVLFIDLDRFKDVNDSHGHAVGDEVLRAAADRLRTRVPKGGTLARKGGDEFVILAPGFDRRSAAALAAEVVALLAHPLHTGLIEHRCGASVGIALAPEHGRDRDELLRCADIALYEAKGNGRGRHALFAPELDASARERASLLAGLHGAVEKGELVLHFQPRCDVDDGSIGSAEALLRWQHPGRGLLMPGAFIEVAETSGPIAAIGAHVLELAVEQMALWDRQGTPLQRVSVNVSPRQFDSGDLPATVEEILRRHGVEPARLEIEVTESLLAGDVASVRDQLQSIRRLGVTVAMDDFGTGYSSMALLRALPIDCMKIDRAFVKDLGKDPAALAIARTIVTLARALSLEIVAEGIETQEQEHILRELGCDQFQGFLFGKPMPANAFAERAGLAGRRRDNAPNVAQVA